MPPPTAPKLPTIFSFSGSGWLAAYHLGAVRAIQERPRLLQESTFIGSSGGALASAVAALDGDTLKVNDFIKKRAMIARSWPIDLFRLRSLVRQGIDLVIDDVYDQRDAGQKKRVDGTDPMDDASSPLEPHLTAPECKFDGTKVPDSWHRKPSILQREKAAKARAAALLEGKIEPPMERDWDFCREKLKGRCQVYITGLPKFNTIVQSDFASKRELEDALCASSCIPPFAGLPFRLNSAGGQLVTDGGFTNILPRRKERGTVVTLSPFVQLPFHVDVSPLVHGHGMVARWALLPPDDLQLEAIFWCGYRDMDAFLVHNRYDDQYGERTQALSSAMETVSVQLEAAEHEAEEARKVLEAAIKKESTSKSKKGGSSTLGKKSSSKKASDSTAMQIVTSENKTLSAKVADAENKAMSVRVAAQELAAIEFLQKEKVSSQRVYQVHWVNKHVLRFMPTLNIYYLRVIWAWIFLWILTRIAKYWGDVFAGRRRKPWKLFI